MDNGNIIFEKKYRRLTPEDYEQMSEDADNEVLSYKRPDSATFYKNLLENTVRVIIPERIENSGFFIAMAKEAAERNEHDIVITEYEDRYVAEFRINCDSTFFGLKDLIEYADDLSLGCDQNIIVLDVIYYTHATYRNGAMTTPRQEWDFLS